MWTISKWQAKQKTLTQCGKYSWKTLILENQHHFLTMYFWAALKENVRSARILWIIQQYVRIKDFCRGYRKIARNKGTGKPDAETISSWSYDMEVHAKKCVDRYCELANKTTEAIIQSRNTMHVLSSIQRRRQWISGRIVHSLLTHCF